MNADQRRSEHASGLRLSAFICIPFIALLALLTYLPALNNFFISDEFVFLEQAAIADQNPSHLLHFQNSGDVYRLTSHFYYFLAYKLFHLNPKPFYILGLLIHILISWLVYRFVARLAGRFDAGLVAGLFFAIYERHHEAIMWIAAANELLLTLAVLLCLLCWERFLAAARWRAVYYPLAVVLFILGLFSKESAVVVVLLLPALDLLVVRPAGSAAKRLLPYLPFLLIGAVYAARIYASDNFIAEGFYAVSPHFFVVYFRTLNILLLYVYPFLLASFLLRRKWHSLQAVRNIPGRVLLFIAAWLLITPVPYCFLTYLNVIPSRQTYLPSVGTAALIGILGVHLWSNLVPSSRFSRRTMIGASLCVGLIALNIAFVWKKNAQFVKRAAPTKLLLQTLEEHNASRQPGSMIYIVSDTPTYELITRAALGLWTPIGQSRVVFAKTAEMQKLRLKPSDYLFHWDDKRERLIVRKTPGSDE